MEMEKIFAGNRKWVAQKLSEDPEYFKKLARGQTPEYLFIGCSDSRVPANEISGTRPGEMFVHRNIANMVVHTDINMLSVLQYAVEVLKVRHVIVCGHFGCGGVLAAMSDKQFGLIDNWLTNIKDVMRLHEAELLQVQDPEARARRLVELNVIEQVRNLSKTSIIQNAMKTDNPPQLHGLVYDISEGLLRDLNWKAEEEFQRFEHIYGSNSQTEA
jgi:carbonic anhydrase